ncbi:uncharacterized protein LOC9662941 [Selaginella moellendorffii]|uniref:uncharacterized protein LOC9662941 n=1 Tax=Selaginella moellendorffii TaxID=88036 RepID=UPI000D1C921F|nr:uncharacterized protein LOC9662941 [Selaginella moellendorffii]|eukprot:XP_002960212.2 uncharacterized protein LOC9662941 [Selaginella moellendorffii]
MRQAVGALLRQGWRRTRSSSSLLQSFRAADSPRQQWLACIPPPSSRISPAQSFHTAHFSSAAVNSSSSKEGRPGSAEEPPVEDKTEPVSKSGKDEKKATGKAATASGGEGGAKGGDGERKQPGAADDKKVPETAEQKLLKEIRKFEQQLREKDSIIEEKDELVKELKDSVLRGLAELENYRERAKREQESSRKFAVQSFSKDLLDVSDNLSRALSSVGQPKDAEEAKKLLDTLLAGVKMTEKQLMQVLKKYGVERFDPTGEPFDPNVHLAVCEIADPSKPAGTVANVFKVGYLLHERVLRPAEVAVVKAVEAAA